MPKEVVHPTWNLFNAELMHLKLNFIGDLFGLIIFE